MSRKWQKPICLGIALVLLLASSSAGGWAVAQLFRDYFDVDLTCPHHQHFAARKRAEKTPKPAPGPVAASDLGQDGLDPEEDDPCHDCPTCPGGDSVCYSIGKVFCSCHAAWGNIPLCFQGPCLVEVALVIPPPHALEMMRPPRA